MTAAGQKRHEAGGSRERVAALLRRGVILHAPESIDVEDDVQPERIAPGVVVHAGCRLRGHGTSIGPGCELGAEGPVTIEQCCLGHGVRLHGGSFAGSVFLDGVTVAAGAYVRAGCLLEEQACAGHTVGFKQTLLMPFVTTGSLVNFCDVLMAGGSGPQRHSEVGSSFVHFNFTPQGDKATPSLLGDVPRGVMLDQDPIFLGGQGGIIGPLRMAFGSVVPAGVICRQDVLRPNQIYLPCPPESWGMRPYNVDLYRDIAAKAFKNICYIAQLRALALWYSEVRGLSMGTDGYREACRMRALDVLRGAVAERVAHIDQWAEKLQSSADTLREQRDRAVIRRALRQQEKFLQAWPHWRRRLDQPAAAPEAAAAGDAFLQRWAQHAARGDHLTAVQSLPAQDRWAGSAWLQAVVDGDLAAWKQASA